MKFIKSIFFIILLISSSFCFAQESVDTFLTEEETDNDIISNDNYIESDHCPIENIIFDVPEKELKIESLDFYSDNMDCDDENESMIADIQSYFSLQNQYKILSQELENQKQERLTNLKNRESAAIDEINFYPWMPNELDEDGSPTITAQLYRDMNILSIIISKKLSIK